MFVLHEAQIAELDNEATARFFWKIRAEGIWLNQLVHAAYHLLN